MFNTLKSIGQKYKDKGSFSIYATVIELEGEGKEREEKEANLRKGGEEI